MPVLPCIILYIERLNFASVYNFANKGLKFLSVMRLKFPVKLVLQFIEVILLDLCKWRICLLNRKFTCNES